VDELFETQPDGQPDNFDIVPPRPDALIESLRAFGYTPWAAIADLVDNSISAGAHNVDVQFTWDGADSYVTVSDDGRGMTVEQLVAAMRAGSQSPLERRPRRDLGRFGLGLKTASFSQCRKLTVRSRTANSPGATRRWDLDYVGQTHEWRLLHGAAPGSESHLLSDTDLDPSGTTVLWERLDRMIGDVRVDDQKAERRFLDITREVEEHLAMVFHRYLEAPGSINIRINGRRISPWDPFLTDEVATQRLAEERLRLHDDMIMVRPFVLPHHSRLAPELHARAAGPRGWNAQQGFYVYRNQRLLVAGDWLGLGFQKEEHYKLARIAIDIPNSMDHDWDIDVRKSRARPPGVLRDDLRRIARITRERAAAVYRHRGKVLARGVSDKQTFMWNRHVQDGKISYRINRDEPLVAACLRMPPPYADQVAALLRLIEETVPVPLIAIESAERPDALAAPFDGAAPADVSAILRQLYRVLRQQGLTADQAQQRLLTLEPFQQFGDLVSGMRDERADEEAL
jgi:hypothetical protein